ncbi:MAG: hypothetical protein R3B06_14115 [Kofleriaceae bacterium]
MVVAALVVTLTSGPVERELALAQLADDPRLTLGAPVRDHLPVVATTDDAAAGVALVEGLSALSAVARVDVLSIEFEVA